MISFLRRVFRREGRMHKRPFLTAVTVFMVFLIASSVFFVSLGILRISSDYPKVSIQNDPFGVVSSGMGINLSYIPSTNLVWDPSFENICSEDVFTVAEAGGNAIYLHNKSDAWTLPSGAYKDGDLRILSYDEDGQLKQVVDAKVLDYKTEQLGIWRQIDSLEQGNLDAEFIRSYENYMMALLKNGEIVADVTSSSPEKVVPPSEDDPFVDAVTQNAHFYAVTKKGAFFFSSNGKSWDTLSAQEDEYVEMLAVTSIGKLGIACGTHGSVRVCDTTGIIVPSVGTECDLYTAVSDDTRALLAGSGGYVCTTVNGSLFRQLSKDELEAVPEDEWCLSAYSEGEFVLVGRQGQMAVGVFDEEKGKFSFERFEAVLPGQISPKQIAMFSGGDVWVLTDNGNIFAFSRSQDQWHQVFSEKDNQISSICKSSGESILISRGGTLFSASVYTKVTIDHSIGDVEIQNGDMCFLSSALPSVSKDGPNAWDVFGEDSKIQIVSDAPKMAGERSIQISSSNPDTQQAHFISQVISRDELNPLKEKVFYHVRLWLKQTNIDKEEVMVWISGLSEPIGTTFTGVSGNWQEYTFTFAWPAEKIKPDEMEIRLNIGFYGSGEVFADVVRLERDAYSERSIKPQVVDLLSDNPAEFLRLENLALGRIDRNISFNLATIGNERVYEDADGNALDSGVISLESTFRLVKQVNAKPWLVIDSAFSAEEMETLLGYICGGITDTYGKIRVDNGTAVPWNRQFERIVVEICDKEELFETDLQRRAYVDYMISLIVNSKYYSDLRDKIFFIDGMNYDSGTMTSAADYHATVLNVSNSGEDITNPALEDISSMIDRIYQDYYEAIPRNASYTQESTGEWISGLSFSVVRSRVSENQVVQDEQPLSAAEVIEFLLNDLGVHTSMVAVDLPISRNCGDSMNDYLFAPDDDTLENRKIKSSNMLTMLNVVGVVTNVAQGQRAETVQTVPLTHQNDEDYSVGLNSYAYSSGDRIYLIITNPTKEQQQFLIDAHVSSKNISVKRYSAAGEEISLASTKSFLNLYERRYTLQSGQFCIAVIQL